MQDVAIVGSNTPANVRRACGLLCRAISRAVVIGAMDRLVSRRMLERYSHVRMEAKRNAMEALAASTKAAGYDTNHDTKPTPVVTRPV